MSRKNKQQDILLLFARTKGVARLLRAIAAGLYMPLRSTRMPAQTHDTITIDLESVEAPMRLDLPELGAQEQVDPEAAARRILAAHRASRGNSSAAARLMGITYQGLRRAIKRFDLPRRCADGTARAIKVSVDGRTVSLDEAVQVLHAIPNLEVLVAEARVHLTQAVAAGVRLVDLAQHAKVEPSRLTKFRSKSGSLSERELREVITAAATLRDAPIRHRSGRRAAAA